MPAWLSAGEDGVTSPGEDSDNQSETEEEEELFLPDDSHRARHALEHVEQSQYLYTYTSVQCVYNVSTERLTLK